MVQSHMIEYEYG